MDGMRLPAAGLVLVASLAAAASCRAPARELGAGPAGAEGPRALLGSLAGRFGPIEPEPAFDALRPKLARGSLVPSRVFDDASPWTATGDGWRAVEFAGEAAGAAYRIGVRASVPQPRASGQYRGRLLLERLASGRYEWTVEEELAAGPLRPADLAAALAVLVRGLESAGAAEARAAIQGALPRATERLSHLFRIETLSLSRDAGGATAVQLAVRLTPSGLRPFAPRYAAFLEKYATPVRLRAAATDASGAGWWTAEASENLWSLALRVRDGRLVPLAGPADRGVPARLSVSGDYATKMGRFGVGVRGLVVGVELTRAPREKGFVARFQQVPDWRLPFLVEPLLGAPLRYPFEGPGSEVGWAAREGPGGLLFVRSLRVRVGENWIVRWLGGMTSGAVSEFRRGAEGEADLYNRECLLALRDDVESLLASR
jgi:hypothetical protein